jgi:DNA-binding GntR family transcriptional regulator
VGLPARRRASRDTATRDAPDGARGTLAAGAYLRLRERILGGEIAPGTRLVRRTLAEQLDISPIPLTEALIRLETEGLVENEPMVGARVKVWTPAALRADQVLREALECQAARMCSEMASDEEIDRLVADAKSLDAYAEREARSSPKASPSTKRSLSSRQHAFRRHMAFHLSIAGCSGFSSFEEQLAVVWRRHSMSLTWIRGSREGHWGVAGVPPGWHLKLAEAIVTREADLAERTMRAHVRYGQRRELDLAMRRQART